ncbi:DUF397 domain-containing protein [Nocardia terpenica]|uniref:DUF397 domain-containing protein n=1 Tax=Nocardia terpenica TaxID=455432 RepID=UPI0018949AEF|nr:DUF397 domain-containing protein [Nocardia terpenica]MBF6065919.1 DUF397 domain-containing protein [Nocardia terpenica]MBF6108885.1 DUF397 domain-containing protein [Nocardia terpenica]MBF6116163.1 DUF397 domain-containing protein [Nocardia terpenica]MBF6123164.1 DUF397 domain-containing protein [Nocardia terpenica]MBF6153154.1 DUF397 domain-containing protein [Nocardia terpenica]
MIADLSGAHWFESSHSGDGNECVEIAWLRTNRVGVRDSKGASENKLRSLTRVVRGSGTATKFEPATYSRTTPKNPSGPGLVFAAVEWDAFTAAMQDGEFNHPR